MDGDSVQEGSWNKLTDNLNIKKAKNNDKRMKCSSIGLEILRIKP